MRNACVALALMLLSITGIRAERRLTFTIPNALLLFGNYNEIRVVTPDGEQLLHPAVDEGYNRGYFTFPSIAASPGVIAWGFAIGWDAQRRHDKARFALGVYSRARQEWRTYGDFDDIGDAGISPDGAKVAFVARRDDGRMTLAIFDAATGALTDGPYQKGMWRRGAPSWSPDLTRLAVQVHRPDESSFVAVLDLKTGDLRSLGDGFYPRWSPDGRRIAYYSGRKCMVIHPDGTGLTTAMTLKDGWFTAKAFGWGSPVWSPDSTQLLLNVMKNDGSFIDVVLVDLATGRTTIKGKNSLPVFGWITVSSRGRALAKTLSMRELIARRDGRVVDGGGLENH